MIRIAAVDDFAHCRYKVFRVLARPVGVFKDPDDSFRAIEVACRHENADLTQGKMRGDIVICPWHGWKYNLRTGECLWGSPVRLRPYRCEVRDGQVYISMLPLSGSESDAATEQRSADSFGSW